MIAGNQVSYTVLATYLLTVTVFIEVKTSFPIVKLVLPHSSTFYVNPKLFLPGSFVIPG